MLPLGYLFFLLAPAAVLSAPHAGSNDGISNSETAASQTSGLDNAATESFFVDPRHVIEIRHDQMSDDTVIEIPSDQMSGRIRVHYDPDLEPSHEANDKSLELGTSPVPVSDLVKRSYEGDSACAVHREQSQPRTTWYFDSANCVPEKNSQAYHVVCYHGTTHTYPIDKYCPDDKICFQVPTGLAKRGNEITCTSKEDATKMSTSNGNRGVIKTTTKFFLAPPAGFPKILFQALTFDRNGHSLSVYSIVGIADGTMFTDKELTNALLTTKVANPNGEGIRFQANSGEAFATLQLTWKRVR